MLVTSRGCYGEEMRAGHGPIALLRWLKALKINERIRAGD